MNKAHRQSMGDGANKRRTYLRKKGTAYALAAIACVSFLGALWFLSTSKAFSDGSLALTALALISTFASFYVGIRQVDRVQTLPYVPTVDEQIAALPAEEILVRGSEHPAADPGELLRAAKTGEATEAGALMRASQVSPESARGLAEPSETLASLEWGRAEPQLGEQSEVVQGRV